MVVIVKLIIWVKILIKKNPLSIQEHLAFSKDLLVSQQILEKWVQRFYDAYPVNGKECKQLLQVLVLISSRICSLQEKRWFELPLNTRKEMKCPYYDDNARARWI